MSTFFSKQLSAILLMLVMSSTLLACGGEDNKLEGSISEVLSLSFDRVQIRKQDLNLLIEYLRDVNAGSEKVCKIVINTEGLDLGDGKRIKGDTFLERVTITRSTNRDSGFPDIASGSITFDKFEFKDGGKIEGEFEAVFQLESRTLSGKFNSKVEEVEL